MVNFFARLKKWFSRKKEEVPQEVVQEAPVAANEEPQPVKEEKKEPYEGMHKEKICEHCGAPNDDFVRKCWLCKRDV